MVVRERVVGVAGVLARNILVECEWHEIVLICGVVRGSEGIGWKKRGLDNAEHAVEVRITAGKQSAQIDDDVERKKL